MFLTKSFLSSFVAEFLLLYEIKLTGTVPSELNQLSSLGKNAVFHSELGTGAEKMSFVSYRAHRDS